MNILVAHSAKPFIYTTVDNIAEEIKNAFIARDDTILSLRFPYCFENSGKWYEHVLAHSLMKVDNTSILLTLNAPTCYIQHTRHVIWLQEKLSVVIPDLLSSARIIMVKNIGILQQLKEASIENIKLMPIPSNALEWNQLVKYVKSI